MRTAIFSLTPRFFINPCGGPGINSERKNGRQGFYARAAVVSGSARAV